MRQDDVTDADDGAGERIERRRVLQASAGAAVGALGLTSPVTGQDVRDPFGACGSGWRSAPSSYPYVDLTQSDPSTGGDFPRGADEFVIYVHGWLEEFASGGKDQGYTLEQALEQNGYGKPTVAAVWNSTQPLWPLAKRNADRAGKRLAAWLNAYLDEYPDTTVKTVDHSLGSRVILQALDVLGGDEVLDNVSLIGAAVNPNTVCEGSTYYQGIQDSASAVYNYHSRNDEIVCNLYRVAEFESGLGCVGSNCGTSGSVGPAPDNYRDVDVTDTVDAHCKYGKPDVGCVPQIVSNF